jgi:hypothetical protein
MTTETSTPSRRRDPWNTAVIQKQTGHAIRNPPRKPAALSRVAGYRRSSRFIEAFKLPEPAAVAGNRAKLCWIAMAGGHLSHFA